MTAPECTVLLCDDSPFVRRMLRDILTEEGVTRIVEACNGCEAVDCYAENRPDSVFMDIVMPEKTGIEALTEIRERYPDARVVILSSTGTKSNLKKAIDAGACDFLQKPVEKERVLELLRRIATA